MTTVLQFALLGLGAGTAYALLAQGLVLVYRGSGVLNFAHGAMALVGAFLYWQLHIRDGWAFAPAFVASVSATALLGICAYHLVMRPLGPASMLSKVVASLGLLILIQGGCVLIWGSLPRAVESPLPTDLVDIGGVAIGKDRLILFGIALAITALLWKASRDTALGLAIRANADNPRAASTLGWSPHALGTLTWGLGGGLAAVAGIFIAPIAGIDVHAMPMLIIPVLAAALIGRLSSFWLALLGAMTIGIAQSEVAKYAGDITGGAEAIPFVVILAVIVLRGQGAVSRSQGAERLPTLGTGRIRPTVVAGTVALVVVLTSVFAENLTIALGVSLAWATILLSIVVLLGYTGQLSLAQFALGGIAALVAGRLVVDSDFPFVLAFVAGVCAAVLIGLLFALPALRARGLNLAIVTLGLGVAVAAMFFHNDSLTGGIDGTPVGPQSLFGLDLDTIFYPRRWVVLTFALFVICALGVANLRRGATGRRLIAVRTNERAAAALGVSVLGVKLYAFGLAAGIAGIGGILLGFRNPTILYSEYDPFQSVLAAGYAFTGGIGYIFGAADGGALASGGLGSWILDELFPGAPAAWLHTVGGAVIVIFALLHPDGLASGQIHQWEWIRGKVRPRRPAAPQPVLVAERRPIRPAELEITDLTVRFGGVVAVDGVSLRARPGRILGLIGPNGAGKTTVIDTITGFVRPAAGRVSLDGEAIGDWPVHRRVLAGISRSFQSLELFESSTVRENLAVASDRSSRTRYLTDLIRPRRSPLSATAMAAVRELDLEPCLDHRVSDLPYGVRRTVAIARSIAGEPSILLLDEPAAGLSSRETSELAVVLQRLVREWGMAVVLVEHDMRFVMSVCDELVVLQFGKQIAAGPPSEIRRDSDVIAAYLGQSSSASERLAAPSLAVTSDASVGRPA